MKSNRLERDILRWEYDNETKDMYSPPSYIEWLEDKLVELRKHAVVGRSEQLPCDHEFTHKPLGGNVYCWKCCALQTK